jgi:hypothetical protein
VCRLVEPLGLVHVPNGIRSPKGPITWKGDRRHQLADRLWPKIAGPWASTAERPIGDDDCWLWDGAQGDFDYGRLSRGGRDDGLIGPHRAVLEVMDEAAYLPGTAPDRSDLVACHHCDNPLCCNPSHLFWGTQAENSQDMVRKGRHWRAARPRPTVDGRAYARYLEEQALLREMEESERTGAELRGDWCAGYDDGQAGQRSGSQSSLHYSMGYRSGAADRSIGYAWAPRQPAERDQDMAELEAER